MVDVENKSPENIWPKARLLAIRTFCHYRALVSGVVSKDFCNIATVHLNVSGGFYPFRRGKKPSLPRSENDQKQPP
jgi:hypothetical protein